MESEANIARAVMSDDPAMQDEVVKQETLRYAVQRVIMCPYSHTILDISRAVLIDGGDRGRSDIMSAAIYDRLIERFGSLETLVKALGYEVEILDGRKLFAKEE